MEDARRNMIKVALKDGTIHHRVVGEHGASKVLVAAAAWYRHHRRRPDARGVRGHGRDRHRGQEPRFDQPYNLVRATLDALKLEHAGGDRGQARQDGREIFG